MEPATPNRAVIIAADRGSPEAPTTAGQAALAKQVTAPPRCARLQGRQDPCSREP
jgi:hypothetical protein